MREQTVDLMLDSSGWMRNLAARVLDDSSLADDVVQETYLLAMAKPPRESREEAQRSWLAKVVRSVAMKTNRTAGRRRKREQKNQRSGTPLSGDEMLERLEMQSHLASAVRGLAEPYRSVVFKRYYEELSVSDIAAEKKQTESTIRTQLSRGMQKLRLQLDQDYQGDTKRWQGAMLLLVNQPKALPPVHISSPATAVTLIAVATVLFGSSAWFWWPPHSSARSLAQNQPSSSLEPRDSNQALQQGSAIFTTSSPQAVAKENRLSANRQEFISSVESPSSSTSASDLLQSSETSVVVAKPIAQQRVLILDAVTGQPIEGAAVFLSRTVEGERSSFGQTNSQGKLELPNDPFLRAKLEIEHSQFVYFVEPARLRDPSLAVHRFHLLPRFEASLHILNNLGVPLLDAEVTVHHPDRLELLQTDTRGEIRYQFAGSATWLKVAVDGFALLAVKAHAPKQEIKLVEGRELSLEVTDAMGLPLADCVVTLSHEHWLQVPIRQRTDSQGYISLPALAIGEEYRISIRSPGRPAFVFSERVPNQGGWQLSLPESQKLSGHVATMDGEHAVGAIVFYCSLVEPSAKNLGEGTALVTKTSSSQLRAKRRIRPLQRALVNEIGEFELGPVLITEEERFLFVYHPEWVNQVIRVHQYGEPVDLQIERGRVISGRVQLANGDPAAGVMLHLGEKYDSEFESVLGRTKSDEEGRFEFKGVPKQSRRPLRLDVAGSEPVVFRSHIFICAFEPDHILSANGESLQSSEIYASAVFGDDVSNIDLVIGDAEESQGLTLAFVTDQGIPVRESMRYALLRPEGQVNGGKLLLHGNEWRLYSAQEEGRDAREAIQKLLAMPSSYRWKMVAIDPEKAGQELQEVQLDLRNSSASTVFEAAPELAGKFLAVGFPFSSYDPQRLITVGQLVLSQDSLSARLRLDMLEPGQYSFFVLPEAAEIAEVLPRIEANKELGRASVDQAVTRASN